MFSFFKNFKYRSEVMVGVHSILFMVPNLKIVLSTVPRLEIAISEFKKLQKPPLEAAIYISMIVLEKLIDEVPLQTRSVVLQQLGENREDAFRWFGQTGEGIKRGDLDYPVGILPFTMVVGFAIWFSGYAERDGKLSAQAHKIFLADVCGMLLGNSSAELAKARVEGAVHDNLGT